MGAKTSARGRELAPLQWRDPGTDGLTVIELNDDEAEAQWLAAFNSWHLSREERGFAPTAPSPLGKS